MVNKFYEFIKSRLPTGYTMGDEGQTIINGVPDHMVFNQHIREDHEGDVGIFEVYKSHPKMFKNVANYISEVHIEAIAINNDTSAVEDYLEQLYLNLRKNKVSDDDKVGISTVKYINMSPMGQNKSGKQWAVLNLLINYAIQE